MISLNAASAIFNMMRNLGGSIGIAMLSTLVTRRKQFHSVRIGESVTSLTPVVVAWVHSLQSMLLGNGLDPKTAHDTALTILNGEVALKHPVSVLRVDFLSTSSLSSPRRRPLMSSHRVGQDSR